MTEKLPPPSRYFAAIPQQQGKTVTRESIVVMRGRSNRVAEFFSSQPSRTDVERLDQGDAGGVAFSEHDGGVAVRAQRGENG